MGVEFLSREPVLDQGDFIGRAQETAWFQARLGGLRPQNCNLIGEPRSGKTSLLHHLYRQKVGLPAGMTGLYVFIRLTTLPDHDSAAFWSALLAGLRKEMGEAGMEQTAVSLPDTPHDAYDQLESEIDTLLEAKLAGRIIFLIDDFELLLPAISPHDLNWLRALANRYIDSLAFVIGSGRPLVSLLEAQTTAPDVSPLTNFFLDCYLALLTPDEARALCLQAAVAKGRDLDAIALDFLLAEAGRHPGLLKVACESLFAAQGVGERQWQAFVRTDVQLNEHVAWLCRQLWQRRSAEGQAALLALAQGAETIADHWLATRLLRLGLVEERDGGLALFADLFAAWLRRETAVSSPPPSPASPAPFAHDEEKAVVLVNGRAIPLTRLENRLLAYLAARANEVCSIDELRVHVWSPDRSSAVVEKGVNRLRAKIEEDAARPRFILSARGEGYLLRLS
jgi:hypothetical protein